MDQRLPEPAVTDWRALCEELADALDGWHKAVSETELGWVRPDETYLIDRARAALAAEPDGPAVPEGREPASVVGEPSDEELLALVPQGSESDFCLPRGLPSDWVDGDFIAPPEAVVAFARAVLARFGNQPAPPAEGEVAELVAWLRGANWDSKRQSLATRAADLLQQRHHKPVPVAERLPGPGDCDGEGFCWFWSPEDQCWFWERQDVFFCLNYGTEFHWLPATALPLPQGEVE